MTGRLSRRAVIVGLLCSAIALACPARSEASSIVAAGWDLFETLPGTTFMGIPLKGVPVGTHNFAGVGVRNTAATDTIVHRLDAVSAPSGMTRLEMEVLQLMSVDPVAAFGDFIFITLQSARGGPATVGSMTINFGPEAPVHGTFSSIFNIFFDVRVGSLTGQIVASNVLSLSASGVPWGHFPSGEALLIESVNFLLNGQNQLADFFPQGPFMETEPGAIHVVQTAVPEPTSLLLLGSGLLALGLRLRRRQS